jgi:hypothetical protein
VQFDDGLIKKILLEGNYVEEDEISRAEKYRDLITNHLFSREALYRDILE